MKTMSMTPPPDTTIIRDSTPPIIHKVRLLHKDIYTIGHKLSKRDKLGIHQSVENHSLQLMTILIEAAFAARHEKLRILETARVCAEVMKNIIRTEHELGMLDQKSYLRLSKDAVEISKMLNGWIVYIGKT